MPARARQSSLPGLFFGDRVGESAEPVVGSPDDEEGEEKGDEKLEGVQSPAVSRREELDQLLERRHLGVRGGPAASPRAALAQRGAGGELRAAASTERVHTHPVRGHLAQDRSLHRDEKGKRSGPTRGRCAAEAAPPSPGTHAAEELTKGLHGSLAATGAPRRSPPASAFTAL